jgi:hypothetical protein
MQVAEVLAVIKEALEGAKNELMHQSMVLGVQQHDKEQQVRYCQCLS